MDDLRLRNVTSRGADVFLNGTRIGRVATGSQEQGWTAFSRSDRPLGNGFWSRSNAVDAVVAAHHHKEPQ